jgi:6-phospho-3-hexuloisomerase
LAFGLRASTFFHLCHGREPGAEECSYRSTAFEPFDYNPVSAHRHAIVDSIRFAKMEQNTTPPTLVGHASTSGGSFMMNQQESPFLVAARDLQRAMSAIDRGAIEQLTELIVDARRVVAFGLGREGLMLRAAVMRWMHLGIDAHVAGDMTAPPVGPDDLVVVSDGTGSHQMHATMVSLANEQGATTLVITANPGAPTPQLANHRLVIPAQTMASGSGEFDSILSMGSLFEIALLVFTDVAALAIQARLGISNEEMAARHTNLE